MSTLLRFAIHRINRHPKSEGTASATCLHGECEWEAAPSTDIAQVDIDCMAHTGRTRHDTFARKFEDVALVVRDE